MYIFRGRGYGHGVGMSQWGAKAMAENGIIINRYCYTTIKMWKYYKAIYRKKCNIK